MTTAPNAANAAPLMPICDYCNGTGQTPAWNGGDDPCWRCDGTGRLRITHDGLPSIIRSGHLGGDESLPAYAWPGGYPLAYYPCSYQPATMLHGIPFDEQADMVGDVLCPTCATNELHAAAASEFDWERDQYAMIAMTEEEVSESNIACDECYAIIAYQTYCHDCRESIDCDADNPIHLCPATEPYSLYYLESVPSDRWEKWSVEPDGPDAAKTLARQLRTSSPAAFIHVQPSRLPFPPTLDGDL